MKRILILGASGFVGRQLVDQFSDHLNFQVFGIDYQSSFNDRSHKHFRGDVGDIDFLSDCMVKSDPDIIYYLITNLSLKSTADYTTSLSNSIKHLNILFNEIASIKKTKVVYVGSSSQYGAVPKEKQPVHEDVPFNPITKYGVMKATEELEARRLASDHHVDLSVARIFNISGPYEPSHMVGGAFVSQLTKQQSNKNFSLKVGNLHPRRDIMDVRDAAKALREIGLRGEHNEIYNICTGRSISIKHYLDLILAELDISPRIQIDSQRVNPNEIIDLVGDNSKIIDSLGWEPSYQIKETIRDLIKSYQ